MPGAMSSAANYPLHAGAMDEALSLRPGIIFIPINPQVSLIPATLLIHLLTLLNSTGIYHHTTYFPIAILEKFFPP